VESAFSLAASSDSAIIPENSCCTNHHDHCTMKFFGLVFLLFIVHTASVNALASESSDFVAIVQHVTNHSAVPLMLRDFAQTGRGVGASSALSPDAQLFRASVEHALVASRARQQSVAADAAWTACLTRPRCRPPMVALIVRLLELRAAVTSSPDSEFAPFIRLLPKSFDEHLIHWPLLARASPYFSLYSMRTHYLADQASQQVLDELFESLKTSQPTLFNSELFAASEVHWAWRAIASRSFGWNETISADPRENDMAMLPLTDLFNHRFDAPVVVHANNSYSLHASSQGASAGDQLFLRYFDQQQQPTLAILSSYGFVPREGPAAMKLSVAWASKYEALVQKYEEFLRNPIPRAKRQPTDGSNETESVDTNSTNDAVQAPVESTTAVAESHIEHSLKLLERVFTDLGCIDLSSAESSSSVIINDHEVPLGYSTCELLFNALPETLVALMSQSDANVEPMSIAATKQRFLLRSFVKQLQTLLLANEMPAASLHAQVLDQWLSVLTDANVWTQTVARLAPSLVMSSQAWFNQSVSALNGPAVRQHPVFQLLTLLRNEVQAEWTAAHPQLAEQLDKAKMQAAMDIIDAHLAAGGDEDSLPEDAELLDLDSLLAALSGPIGGKYVSASMQVLCCSLDSII
jgi:hypothetical protein